MRMTRWLLALVAPTVLVSCRGQPAESGPEKPTPHETGSVDLPEETGLDSGEDSAEDSDASDLFGCPEAYVWPRSLSWTDTRVTEPLIQTVLVRNDCLGDVALTSAASWSGGTSGAFTGALTLSPLPAGETGVLEIQFLSPDFDPQLGSLVITTNDPDAPTVTVSLFGEAPEDYDRDGYPDTRAGGTDCDDGDANIHPEASEIFYDGVDQNCIADDDDDLDGDGFGARAGGGEDCDDDDAAIFPGAPEIWYDGVDSDCGEDSDYDVDRDGFDAAPYGGGDCDDTDASVFPGASDVSYDGIDSDCAEDSDYDDDRDGFDAYTFGGSDCDDTRSDIYPDAFDLPYDGIDADCAGDTDYDVDADGFAAETGGGMDCNDSDAEIHPGAVDVPYDGKDSDCSGGRDYDADGDGVDSDDYGGADCDDSDEDILPGATEVWYDGVDSNCAGDDDYDADKDGDTAETFGGTDCDDSDPNTYAGAPETWYDGLDADCAGDDDYDADGDGFDAEGYVTANGTGDDCDDTDPSIYAGAADVAYDGVDGDCAGDSDYDADGDGYDGEDYGGRDCDDADAGLSPSESEAQDLVDNDCDGLVDEDFVQAGAVFITEVMSDPLAVSDARGEWIELLNVSDDTLDLRGWAIYSDDGDQVIISEPLVIAPTQRVLLGVDDDSDTNGGVSIDLAYPRASSALSNSRESLSLEMGSTVIFALTYTDSWDLVEGASLSLDPSITDTDYTGLSTSWCASTSSFGVGDLGTPGEENDACASLDSDGDGYSELEGDCDNTDASISPDAPETYNGVDDDCDDLVDNLDPDDAGFGSVKGSSSANYLSYGRSLSVADLDADGAPEVLTGSLYLNSYYGGVYIIGGEDLTGEKVSAASVATANVIGKSAYNYMASMGSTQGDQDGDGELDLFVAGSDYLSASGNLAGLLFLSAGSLTGTLSPSDADTSIKTESTAYNYQPATTSHLDLDGDGLSEIAWGNFFESGSSTSVRYAGRTYLVTGDDAAGGGTIRLKTEAAYLYGDDSGDQLGQTVGGGDADGDGYDDLLLVAPYDEKSTYHGGTVYLIAGSLPPWTSGSAVTHMSLSVSGTTTDTNLCQYAIPQLADYDGDGAMDLAVATDTSTVDARAWVFSSIGEDMGSATAMTVDEADITITDEGGLFPEADAYYSAAGQALASGDFDHDGIADLAIGGGFSVYSYSPYKVSRGGAAWMLSLAGVEATIDASEAFATVGLDELAWGTGSVLAAGDLLGDGADDLLFGNPWASSSAGVVWFVPF